MTIAAVNLIPAARVRARRVRVRVMMWVWIVPVCSGLLGAAYVWQRLAGLSDTAAVTEALAKVQGKIKDTDIAFAQAAKEVREARANLQANRAVGEQPDWSVLLGLVTEKLAQEAALTSLKLEPIVVEPSKDEKERAGRPERLRLTMKGIAKSQEAASKLVLALEGAPFDRVNLVEAKRADAGTEVAYQIVCELTDPGGDTAEPDRAGAPGGGK